MYCNLNILTNDSPVMLLPESENKSIQNRDDEDKAEHLYIDEDPVGVGVPERKINPVNLISSFLKKVWYSEQVLLLPAHTLAVEVQLPGVVDRGERESLLDP